MAGFDANLIVETLTAKGLLAVPCPACRQGASYSLLPGFVPLPLQPEGNAGNDVTVGASAATIAMACKSCGYVLQFLATSFGM